MAEEDFRGEPLGYSIAYLGSDLKKYFFYADYLTNSTTLTNLDIYTMYVINVSAVSSGGIGPENTAWARTDAAGTLKFLMISKNEKKNFRKRERSFPHGQQGISFRLKSCEMG